MAASEGGEGEKGGRGRERGERERKGGEGEKGGRGRERGERERKGGEGEKGGRGRERGERVREKSHIDIRETAQWYKMMLFNGLRGRGFQHVKDNITLLALGP